MKSIVDMIRRLALNDPEAAYGIALEAEGLRPGRACREVAMMDYDGDETRAYEVSTAMLEGGPISIVEYPYGTSVALIGAEALAIVRRERQGDSFKIRHYVFDEALERYHATGVFGDIEDHDPRSFLDLLLEHGILKERGIDPRDKPWDDDYVQFLLEHGASDNVIDRWFSGISG